MPDQPPILEVLAAMVGAVDRAVPAVLAISRRPDFATQDKHGEPVTVADALATVLIAGALRERFPHVPIVGEEADPALLDTPIGAALDAALGEFAPEVSRDRATLRALFGAAGAEPPPGGRAFALDPVDGTVEFVAGTGQFAICLGLIERGAAVAGVIAVPAHGRLAAGGSGLGAFQRPCGDVVAPGAGDSHTVEAWPIGADRPLAVSAETQPARARIVCSRSHRNPRTESVIAALQGRATADQARLYPTGSALKYVLVAAGEADLYLRPFAAAEHFRIWDHAAGVALVCGAGGRATDASGAALDFAAGRTLANNRGLIVSNGPLHAAVREAIAAVGARDRR